MKIGDLKELARIVELAHAIREESFVKLAGGPRELCGYYTCNKYCAALKAAAQITRLPHEHVLVGGIANLVYLLNSELWDDMQGWNADILKLPEDGDSK